MSCIQQIYTVAYALQVKDLANLSLNKPVKLFINENTDVASNLRQEFVKIKQNREGDREAIVCGTLGWFAFPTDSIFYC